MTVNSVGNHNVANIISKLSSIASLHWQRAAGSLQRRVDVEQGGVARSGEAIQESVSKARCLLQPSWTSEAGLDCMPSPDISMLSCASPPHPALIHFPCLASFLIPQLPCIVRSETTLFLADAVSATPHRHPLAVAMPNAACIIFVTQGTLILYQCIIKFVALYPLCNQSIGARCLSTPHFVGLTFPAFLSSLASIMQVAPSVFHSPNPCTI